MIKCVLDWEYAAIHASSSGIPSSLVLNPFFFSKLQPVSKSTLFMQNTCNVGLQGPKYLFEGCTAQKSV